MHTKTNARFGSFDPSKRNGPFNFKASARLDVKRAHEYYGRTSDLTNDISRALLKGMKKAKSVIEPVSLGTRLAEKTRAAANQLSDEERERLLQRGLHLIYGGTREKKPAHRR